jgi:hypothetical protein
MQQKNHSDTVIGLRQKGTDNWAYLSSAGKVVFGPLSAQTLFYETSTDAMSKAQGQQNIEQVPIRRSLEVLQTETV